MMQMLRTELKKALCNRMLLLSLLIGCVLSLLHVWQIQGDVSPLIQDMKNMLSYDPNYAVSFDGVSLFIHWMAHSFLELGSSIFYFIWPLLAAIPYGCSYYQDRKSGLFNQMVSRCSVKQYYFSKFMAAFVSGGIVVSIPVLLNLLVNALFLPAIKPNPGLPLYLILNGQAFSALYYTHPWLHGLLWCGLDFLWGGIAAGLCFLFGSRPRHPVVILTTPFLLMMLSDSVIMLTRHGLGIREQFSPLQMAASCSPSPFSTVTLLIAMGSLLVLGFSVGYWQVVKHELA